MNCMQEIKNTSSAADNTATEESEDSVSGYDLRNEKWAVARKTKKKKNKTKKCVEDSLSSDLDLSNTGAENMKCDCIDGKKLCDMSTPGKDSIICDICKQAFHEKCQGLSTEAHEAIKKYKLFWMCGTCKQEIVTLKDKDGKESPKFQVEHIKLRITEAESKIISVLKETAPEAGLTKQLEDKIAKIEKSLKEFKEQQTRVETSINEHKESVQNMPKVSEKIKQSADQLQKIVQTRDKENRDQNIILHNIPEFSSQNMEECKQYDVDSFYNIAYALMGSKADRVEVETTIRLGKQKEPSPGDQNKPAPKARLMLIKLKCKEDVNVLLRCRTKLKDLGFPNVYLTKDLSPEERENQKRLRMELDRVGRDRYRIFRGEIVPRK